MEKKKFVIYGISEEELWEWKLEAARVHKRPGEWARGVLNRASVEEKVSEVSEVKGVKGEKVVEKKEVIKVVPIKAGIPEIALEDVEEGKAPDWVKQMGDNMIAGIEAAVQKPDKPIGEVKPRKEVFPNTVGTNEEAKWYLKRMEAARKGLEARG
jgi:hypothetical protein